MITKLYNLNEVLTLQGALKKDGRRLVPKDTAILKNSSVIFDENTILWVGEESSFDNSITIDKEIDMSGHVLTPEIVDSHTHLVFAGDRSFEYTLRLNGADYQEIANAGGGILSTMDKTIAADTETLFNTSVEKIARIHSYGVGTIEIKSGYGLTLESERKLTTVIHKLKEHFSGRVNIINTFMAAHAVPKEYKSSEEYMDIVVIPLLEEFAQNKSIDFVDIFHEEGYFNTADVTKLIKHAKNLGIPARIHADEFNDNGGAALAAKLEAHSADHLLALSSEGIKALANSNTVATLLPGTAFFLGKPLPRAREILDGGCKVAIASDYNPGSCHCDNLVLIASIAAKNLNINSAELWAAITLNAAASLGLSNQGAIEVGMKPRFSIFKAETIDQITYSWGQNLAVTARP